ncbi:MAG: hypothetical protein FJY07_00855 [Bacteroidetes bacterium]|nr:hypothetical protein [Bacteroidota bacterium]
MKTAFKIFILLHGLLLQHFLNAQTASLTTDTNAILVGDQINMKLAFFLPAGSVVQWPALNDTIISKIEILNKTKVDTSLSSDKTKMNLLQVFKITCFDSGYYAIPPIKIGYKKPGDALLQTAETPAILLTVSSVSVNTQEDIRDIKKPLEAPFTLKEAMPWIIGLFFFGLVVYGVIYYLKKRKKAEPVFRSPVRLKIPAHQVALDALENLRQRKLWQSGMIKDYYTELTEIIREYILAKFNIHAPELTSDEILSALNYTATDQGAKQLLGQTFVIADLVKFAKMQPLPAEHDTSLSNAVSFVKATMFFGSQAESASGETTASERKLPVTAERELNSTGITIHEPGKEGSDV